MCARVFSRNVLGAILLVGLGQLIAAPLKTQESSIPVPAANSPQRALLNRYCVTCHNEKLKTAGLLLDNVDVENPFRLG